MMRFTKFTGAVAGLAAVGLMAGCSAGGGTAAEGDKEVTVWIYPVIADEAAHKAFWDETIADFEAEHEGVTVDYEIFPWANRDESLQTAIAAKKGPDLVYLVPDQLAAYESSIEPIDDYLSAEYKDSILDNVADSITLDGGLMGAPMLTSVQTLICNQAAFDAAGVTEFPETWDDILEIAPKFVDAGMYVANYPASAENTLNMTFYPLLWQAGGEVFTDEGEIGFAGDEGVEALSFLTELADMGALDPDALTTSVPLEQTLIAQGKVGCTWNNVVTELEPFWGEENITVLAPLTDEESVAYGTVGTLAMLSGAGDKEMAGAFAEFATSAEVVTPYLEAAGYFSALEGDPIYPADSLLGQVEQYVPNTTVGELNTASREVMGVLSPEIQAALLGQKTPEQALTDAETAAAPLLK
ncbi:ABC transporter substrate-binding protein [Microbacterium sp. NPDC055903]